MTYDQLCHDETRVLHSSLRKFSQCWDEEGEAFFPTSFYLKQLLRVMGSCWVSNLLKNKGSNQISYFWKPLTILMIH